VPHDEEGTRMEDRPNREVLNAQGRRDRIKVFQANLGRGREATELLQRMAEEEKVDVVLIQESYCYMPAWAGWSKYGGGRSDKIATMVRTGRRSIELDQFAGPTTRTVIVEGERGDIALTNVYVPPKGSLGGTLAKLDALLASRRGRPTIIGGDLNAKHPSFGGEEDDGRGRQVIDLVGAANLVVENDPDSLPTFETANGRSWIDVTFSRDATVEDWEVREEETLSDHRGISFSIITEEERTDREIDGKRFLMTSQADWKLFRETLVAGREEIQEEETAEGAAAKLQELAMRACNSSMPWKARKARKNKVWWNASLGRLRKESRQARREAQREQDPERKTTLLREYRRKKAAYGKAIKEAKISSLRETLSNGSPEDPWGLAFRIIASKRRREKTVWRTIQDSEGNWAGTRKETAMALIRKYFPADDPGTDTPDNKTTRETETRWSEEREREISLQELEKTVKERPKKKAPGIDGFPTAGLEHLFEALGETLAEVLNRCLREGRFPKEWKQAEVAWIPKPGGTGVRPVCLLPTIGKVYDKILATRLSYYLEAKGLLSDRQFGFRKGRGTAEAIGKAATGIKRAREEGKHAVLVALDIRNAFNSAWYPKLSQLLARSGCPGNLGRAISDFLRDRSVASEGATVKTERGCPQGSCLGPILWLLVMEEWFQEVDRLVAPENVTVEIQAFADDQLITITGPSMRGLEEAWEAVWAACQRWAATHKLEYAPEKTTAVFAPSWRRGKKMAKRGPRLKIGGTTIRTEESMKYLGVIIDRGLSWREHARHAARNIMTSAQKIRGIAGRTWGTEPRILREIFDGAIRPALMYGAEIWGEKAEDPIIRRHLRAAQRAFLLGVTRAYRTTSNVALEVLAGCTPPHFEAAARHANWRERGTAEFEGKAVFAEGPHPAEPERKWEELPAETIPGTSFWTDASQGDGGTAIGIVKTEGGETKETRGLRLQDGYPTHMAELYALGIAIKSVAGQRGGNFNFVTDSRVALDMLTKRKGGAAHAILKEVERIETEGATVKLWWSSDRNRGIAEADRIAKRARENPEEFPEDHAPITGRMIKKEATRVAMAKWQQEWDQGDKGRATHEIIGTVDRRLRGWSHRAVCLLTGHGPFRGYLRRFNLTETTGECVCSTGAQDTAKHVMEDCEEQGRMEARGRWRRRQEAMGGPVPFKVTAQTSEEEVRNFNKFTEEVRMEEELEA
jgi:hypothetical protein